MKLGPRSRPLPRNLAAPGFPGELPIVPRIGEIVDLLRRHQVLVVAGETGSGKTTQLPKACLAAGLGRRGAIAHTQPRRLAARTVAARIAEELNVDLGREVGYAVRFADRTSDATVVKVMTDGLLLNEIQRDRRLGRYECVIVDEAHERSLNVDFILGSLKRLLEHRRDLKVVVTSATIDVQAFAKHFGDAPVVQVSGRGYPVEIVYRGVEEDSDAALVDCVEAIIRDAPAGRRDILVFQTGEREIFDNARLLKRVFADRLDVLPLYARLPAAEQQRVFSPGPKQRVVLATNVAETSITVPNIGYVVDPGFARISRYSYRAKVQRLPTERISQASAQQRAGRCGRVAPGVCYRLYDEQDFAAQPAYTDPEIRRTNLAAVVLAMRAFRLGDIAEFPFVDPPDPRAVRDAVRLLHELQALDDDQLTETGRTMARLPVDPRLARMLVGAARTGVLAEALIVVSALASQDPRLRPLDRRAAADAAHAQFAVDSTVGDRTGKDRSAAKANAPASDFAVYLNLWRWLEETRAAHSRSAFRRVLEKRFLSPPRVREWHALHRQLLLACRHLGFKINTAPADDATLHRALLSGFLGFIGLRRELTETRPANGNADGKRSRPAEYDGARGLKFRIFPASALRRRAPRWVFAAEIGDTGQTWAHCVAEVEPAWIEAAAKHIAKSTFSDPRWDERRGEAVVLERVTVYGLTVAADRPKPAAQVDMPAAREIFVREALLRRDRRESKHRLLAPFLDHNEALLRRVEERQARGRRADLVASESARAHFYLHRLPSNVYSVATWQRYAQGASAAQLAAFEMSEADLLANADVGFDAEDFPSRLRIGDTTVTLAYKFAPGEPDDGVTARVDLATLQQLQADALDWLVPGFFEEKCLALVKALPKAWRRRLGPAADRVRGVLPQLLATGIYRRGKLLPALAAALRTSCGVAVPPDAWRPEALPPHLRMNVQLQDRRRQRRKLDQDRDIDALRGRALAVAERTVGDDWRREWERHGIVQFPEEGVPPTRTVRTVGGSALVYPVLVDRGASVDLLIRAEPGARDALNRHGFARLALLAESQTVRRLRREIERDATLAMHHALLGTIAELADAVLLASAWFACFEGRDLPTTRAEFAARLKESTLAATVAATLEQTRQVLKRRLEVSQALEALASPAFAPSRADMAGQLQCLVAPGFLHHASKAFLDDLPRYLAGIAYRIDNLQGRVAKDRAGMAAVAPWEARLAALPAARDSASTAELRQLVQEFRIATFSQPVGTARKVSPKRLGQCFDAAEALLAGG